MELRVNDYVRTEDGKIFKWNKLCTTDKKDYEEHTRKILFDENKIKSSPNIIDLIEVGDYVNGYKVLEIEKDYLFDYTEEINVLIVQNGEVYEVAKKIYSDGIKSIVTKEMYSRVEYRVENN